MPWRFCAGPKIKFFSSFLIAACFLAPGLHAQIWVGADAPDFEAKGWFNEPPGTNLEELRGRVVYMEFWQTW